MTDKFLEERFVPMNAGQAVIARIDHEEMIKIYPPPVPPAFCTHIPHSITTLYSATLWMPRDPTEIRLWPANRQYADHYMNLQTLAEDSQEHVLDFLDVNYPQVTTVTDYSNNSIKIKNATVDTIQRLEKVGGIRHIQVNPFWNYSHNYSLKPLHPYMKILQYYKRFDIKWL